MHRYHTLKYLKNSKKTVEKFKLTDQRRNKALPCSYVDQYAQLFNADALVPHRLNSLILVEILK